MKVSPEPIVTLAAALRELVEPMVDERVAKALAEIRRQGEFLSTTEAAAYARVTPKTIRSWIKAGRLEPHRAGRKRLVHRVDLDELLREAGNDHGLSPEGEADRDFR